MSVPPRKPVVGQRARRQRSVAGSPATRRTGAAPSGKPAGDDQRANARAIAFEALVAIDERPVFLRTVLDELSTAFDIPARERGLALEIAAGVTRRRATLDAVLAPHIRAPDRRIEPRLRIVLRMGAYQLLFLATPPHAAVFEMVELARRQQPRWTRLVNGVLRSVQRDLTATIVLRPQADAVPVCALRESVSDRVATPDSANGAAQADWDATGISVVHHQLKAARFAAPETAVARYAAAAFSLPEWLAARWNMRYGAAELLRLAAWFATPGRVTLRINPLRAATSVVLDQLHAAGIAAVAGSQEGVLRLLESTRIEKLPGFAEGLFSVQDESAIAAAALLAPQSGQRVLDLCAAPGGKSAALAERMQNQGQIVAADTDAGRVALIAPGAARLGLTIIEPVIVRPDSSDVPAGPFDCILLDVPCSNTGVLGKRPEARWRISESGITELTEMQSGLLGAALERLAVGGRLVYSTCSIEPEENERVVCGMLADRPDFTLVCEQQHRPGLPGDGGYQALVERVGNRE